MLLLLRALSQTAFGEPTFQQLLDMCLGRLSSPEAQSAALLGLKALIQARPHSVQAVHHAAHRARLLATVSALVPALAAQSPAQRDALARLHRLPFANTPISLRSVPAQPCPG